VTRAEEASGDVQTTQTTDHQTGKKKTQRNTAIARYKPGTLIKARIRPKAFYMMLESQHS